MDRLDGTIILQQSEAMGWDGWKEEEVKNALSKIKSRKQPGPDKIKGEILKWFKENPICIQTLTQSLNTVITKNEVPSDWKI